MVPWMLHRALRPPSPIIPTAVGFNRIKSAGCGLIIGRLLDAQHQQAGPLRPARRTPRRAISSGYPEDTLTLCQGTSWSDAKALAMVSASKRLGTVLVISSRVRLRSAMDMVTL